MSSRNFAREQLEKYGWQEGTGLGKTQNGITEPLRPKMKLNKEGIGFSAGDEYKNNWWEQVFNKAASNISVETGNDEKSIKNLISNDPIEITTKRKKKQKKNEELSSCGYFYKGSTLESGLESFVNNKQDEDEDEIELIHKTSDEDLFTLCGGRTAHKGARHGLKLSGKLARLEKQEAELNNICKENGFVDSDNQSELSKTTLNQTCRRKLDNGFSHVKKKKEIKTT